MVNFILFDGPHRLALRPLTDNKPVAMLTIGATTIKEKWERDLKLTTTVLTEPEFEEVYPPLLMDCNVFIHAAVLPTEKLVAQVLSLKPGQQLLKGDETLAFMADEENEDLELPDFENISFEHEVNILSSPTEWIKQQSAVLRDDIAFLSEQESLKMELEENWLTNKNEIYIEESASCKNVFINASEGPVFIAKNALVMEGAMLRGPLYIGEGAVVKMGAKLYGGTSIGKQCVVAGEIKNSIIMDYSNKGHEGYIGDAIIGSWCNLGADTNASNLKNNLSPIKIWNDEIEDFSQTEALKCGVIMGDYCLTAIQTAINTATKIGVCSQVFGSGLTPKQIKPFSFGFDEIQIYDIHKCIKTIKQLKRFKNEELEDAEERLIRDIFQKYNA